MKIIESKTVGLAVTRWQVHSEHSDGPIGLAGVIYKSPRGFFVSGAHGEDLGRYESLEDAINAIGERYRWPT